MATLNFDYGVTQSFANTGMIAGTGSSYTTTAASNCCINGKFATSLGAQTNAALPTTDFITGLPYNPLQPNQCCVLIFGINAAGAIGMVQGQILGTLPGLTTTPGGFLRDPPMPTLPDNFCVLAYTVVRTAPSASPWIPGTGAWTASGVSASTFQNVSQLPSRPQTS